MDKITNPFIISGIYVGEEYFCDRKDETKELCSNILNWRNTVLISPRRMGKSGLIEHTFHQPEIQKHFLTFNIDIMNTNSSEELAFTLSKGILDKILPMGEKMKTAFIKIVTSISGSFTLNTAVGDFQLAYKPNSIKQPEKTLEELFRYLDQTEQTAVLAIDEFQVIADYPDGKQMMAYIRSLVQRCTQTRFIFSGSNRRMMERLFNNPSEPFFQSCSPISLEAINKDTYFKFVKKHFNSVDKEITQDCFSHVYDIFDGHTWYIQNMMNRIFERTSKGETAGDSIVLPVLDYILKLNDRNFSEQLSRYSIKQRNLLISIALNIEDGKALCGSVSEITSGEFIQKYNLISASSIQNALKPLYEKDVLVKYDGQYLISNKLFSIWLLKKFSSII